MHEHEHTLYYTVENASLQRDKESNNLNYPSKNSNYPFAVITHRLWNTYLLHYFLILNLV